MGRCVARDGVRTGSKGFAFFNVILAFMIVLLPLGYHGVRIGEASHPGPVIHSFDDPDGIDDRLSLFDDPELAFGQSGSTSPIMGEDDELSPTEVLAPHGRLVDIDLGLNDLQVKVWRDAESWVDGKVATSRQGLAQGLSERKGRRFRG